MKRAPLPAPFDASVFSVRDATASGIPPGRLRAVALDSSVWGIRRAAPLESLHDRCRAYAQRLRVDCFFSHSTAALLYGAPLPLALERAPRIHISVAGDEPPPHARGLTGHHVEVETDDVVLLEGLRVTSPARTWFDLAHTLVLEDLVAVGDYLIHRKRQLTGRDEIMTRLDGLAGRRGIRVARQAAHLLRDLSESRPESTVRVILVQSGLPEPEINHTLIDSETGRQVRPDFIYRAKRMIIEYQGDYHRTKAQWRKDMTRRSKLEEDGWYVMEINADDIRDPNELVRRIRAVLANRL